MTYHPDAARIPRVRSLIDWLQTAFSPRIYPWFRDEFIPPGELLSHYRGKPMMNPVAGFSVPGEVAPAGRADGLGGPPPAPRPAKAGRNARKRAILAVARRRSRPADACRTPKGESGNIPAGVNQICESHRFKENLQLTNSHHAMFDINAKGFG